MVMLKPIITLFPIRAQVDKFPLRADVLSAFATVGVYVPLQIY
jgi:hypothetical protein